jgi:hypothetical protein
MGSTQKKAVLRMHDGNCLSGYLPAAGFVRRSVSVGANQDAIEFLDLSARRQVIPLASLKWVCFVRDFNSGEPANPERLLRTTFSGRPRQSGVWLRMALRDESTLEGLAENDLTLLDPAGVLAAGYPIQHAADIPAPHQHSGTQRSGRHRRQCCCASKTQAACLGSPADRSFPCRDAQGTVVER